MADLDTKELIRAVNGMKDAVSRQLDEVKKRDEEISRLGKSTSETADRIASIDSELKQIAEDFQGRVEGLSQKLSDLETKGQAAATFTVPDELQSLGSRFTGSEEYKNYLAARGSLNASQPVNVGSFHHRAHFNGNTEKLIKRLVEQKAISGDTVLRDFFSAARLAEIFESERRRTERVRDLIPVIPTSNSIISYVRETGFTNNAAPVAEGNRKPESSLSFTEAQAQASTIAHWIQITRQLSQDIPALQGLINQRLVEGIMLEEDAQIMYGSGTGADMLGLMVDPAVPRYNWSSGPYQGGNQNDTKIDAIRRAIAQAQLARYPVDGIVMHPMDGADIELQKDGNGMYLWTSVGDIGQTRLWRTRVIVTDAINQGEALVGSFRLAATLWDLEDAQIRTTDSHADYFIYNRLVVLGEERIALTIHRPQAFRAVIFDHAPTAPVVS